MKLQLTHPLFQKAIPVLEKIESHGYEAYFVGGCVRDSLLGQVISDIDIASSAFPQEIQAIFPKHFDVGIDHGTVVVLHQGEAYEITTFRTESTYTDHRRPDQVAFVRNLEEDTLRRDFTMNAIAIDRKGQVYDYHQGYQDLENQLIRAVGRPHARFEEDALRMMRGVRFASQLGFKIESATFQAIQDLASQLQHISIERIRIEFEKLMLGRYLDQAASEIEASQLLDYFPQADNLDYRQGLTYLIDQTQPETVKTPALVWGLLMIGMGVKPGQIKPVLRAWTLSNDLIDRVLAFVDLDRTYQARDLTAEDYYRYCQADMATYGQYLQDLGCHEEADRLVQVYQDLPIHHRQDIAINGRQVMDLLDLTKGGPVIGQVLAQVETAILKGDLVNDATAIRDFIQQGDWD